MDYTNTYTKLTFNNNYFQQACTGGIIGLFNCPVTITANTFVCITIGNFYPVSFFANETLVTGNSLYGAGMQITGTNVTVLYVLELGNDNAN